MVCRCMQIRLSALGCSENGIFAHAVTVVVESPCQVIASFYGKNIQEFQGYKNFMHTNMHRQRSIPKEDTKN